MRAFQRVLLCGTGPVAIQLAVNFKKQWNCCVGIAGRESVRSQTFFSALNQSKRMVKVSIQNAKHQRMAGQCSVSQVFQGYQAVEGGWDTVVLSVTTDAYIDVLKQMDANVLKQVQCIVLVSPTFGSNSLIRNYMREYNANVEIISFSTYFGDTRWFSGEPSEHVLTTAVKKKVFIGSTEPSSETVNKLCDQYAGLGLKVETMASPFEAETRNISLYVHPPLFMNPFSLHTIFGEADTKKYVYKMFPEGPITQHLIRNMLAQWKEMMSIFRKLHLQPLNLLQFMTDDNYPVRAESLSRDDIENFQQVEPIHQEYLLYIRYTSLLIDPFSEPDPDGKYFDFSAVPLRQIFMNSEGKLDIPRMPKEDYYRIKVIQGIAQYVGTDCPTIDRFIQIYERKLEAVAEAYKRETLSQAFTVQSYTEDLTMICHEIEKGLQSDKEEAR